MTLGNAPEEIEIIIEAKNKILDSIDQDQPYTAINHMDFLLKILDTNFKKQNQLEKLEKKIKNFLLNPNNNRLLRLNQKVKTELETAIEFYDIDIGNDQRLFYNEPLEKDLLQIQNDMKEALATIINQKITGELELE